MHTPSPKAVTTLTVMLGAILGVDQCPTAPTRCTVDVGAGTLVCEGADSPATVASTVNGMLLALDMSRYACVEIEADVTNPQGHFFHLGNSEGNDTHCGDYGETSNDSEAWLQDHALGVCSSDLGGPETLVDNPSAVALKTDHITAEVCDGWFFYHSEATGLMASVSSPYVFQFDGDEFDPEREPVPVNDTILWLGLNRVVNASRAESGERVGTGLETVTLEFVPSP